MDFDQSVEAVRHLKSTPDRETQGRLYGLFKQATMGDAPTTAPSRLNLMAHGKWAAWDKLRGTSTEDAKCNYIALATELKNKFGVN